MPIDGRAELPPAARTSRAPPTANAKWGCWEVCTESAAESASKVVRPAKSVAAELANNIPVARGIDRERALECHFLVVVRQKNFAVTAKPPRSARVWQTLA